MLQVFAAGNLGKDAQLRRAGSDDVCSFSIATERKIKGEKVTTWLSCSLWGKRGAALAQYLTKGSKVSVIGELSTREHDGKTYIECRVSELTMLGGGDRGGASRAEPRASGGGGGSTGGGYSDADYGGTDDIPF